MDWSTVYYLYCVSQLNISNMLHGFWPIICHGLVYSPFTLPTTYVIALVDSDIY